MNRTNRTVLSGMKQQGFTLIELMIVVAVITILAAIGYPSYIQHTIKAKRAAAEAFMLNVATKQEQFILDARTYTLTLGSGGLGLTIPADVAKNYNVTLPVATTTAYTITATPINAQLLQDTKCATLTLTQTGAKLPTTAGCW